MKKSKKTRFNKKENQIKKQKSLHKIIKTFDLAIF